MIKLHIFEYRGNRPKEDQRRDLIESKEFNTLKETIKYIKTLDNIDHLVPRGDHLVVINEELYEIAEIYII